MTTKKSTGFKASLKDKIGLAQTIHPKPVHPEDNWELIANPDRYLDQLPQPFRFINSCLDQLILKPVFAKISNIEDQKKTPEYEGLLREVQATGFMEIEGISTINQVNPSTKAGGILDKEGQHQILNKTIIGDKFGQLHLFDAGRKLILDKKLLFESGRRIQHISNASIAWMDTKLTYLAVTARGSPFVKICCFKNNENKLVHIYSLNTCPSLSNPDNLEMNPDQIYLDLPCETSISLDCVFMTVTSFSGEVKVLKLPPIINPFRGEDSHAQGQPVPTQVPPAGAKGQPAQAQQPSNQALNKNPSQAVIDENSVLKHDIENIPLQNLDIATLLIAKIEARKEIKFKDQYAYNPNPDAVPTEPDTSLLTSRLTKQLPTFSYKLGSSVVKDLEGGDAGSLLKKSKMFPIVHFIRTKFCSKPIDVSEKTSNWAMREYFITTGLCLSYLNQMDVQVYSI